MTRICSTVWQSACPLARKRTAVRQRAATAYCRSISLGTFGRQGLGDGIQVGQPVQAVEERLPFHPGGMAHASRQRAGQQSGCRQISAAHGGQIPTSAGWEKPFHRLACALHQMQTAVSSRNAKTQSAARQYHWHRPRAAQSSRLHRHLKMRKAVGQAVPAWRRLRPVASRASQQRSPSHPECGSHLAAVPSESGW